MVYQPSVNHSIDLTDWVDFTSNIGCDAASKKHLTVPLTVVQ